MGVLKDLETFMFSAERTADDGVPSASMAMLDDPTGPIQTHIIAQDKRHYDANTVYQACSIFKAITALAEAKLIDLGHLTYDTKVVDHVPESLLDSMLDDKTRHLMQYVTVGLLVSHRSGLSQHGFAGYTGDTPLPGYTELSAGQPPAKSPRLRFLNFPGSQCTYSGGGFVILQILLGQIMAKPFPEIMQEMVLGPLKMNRSRFGDLPTDESNFAKAHVTGYVQGTNRGRGYHEFTELAAAGLWTTPSDLLKAVAAIQISLHSDSGFLSRATADAMLAPVSPSTSGLNMAYGCGSDGTFFAHAGQNEPGFTCYVIGAHGYARPVLNGTNQPGTASVCIVTNSIIAS